jgi:excisionase family DNA binding protein
LPQGKEVSLVTTLGRSAWLTTSHVARRLGVSDRTIALWAASGKLPHTTTTSGMRLFRARDVERLAHERLQARVRAERPQR